MVRHVPGAHVITPEKAGSHLFSIGGVAIALALFVPILSLFFFNGVIARILLLMIIDMPTLDTASHPRDMTKMLHRRCAGNSRHDDCLRAHVRKRCGAGEKSKYQELGVRGQAKQRVEM